MLGIIFKAHCIVFLTLVSGIFSYDFDGLNNLGGAVRQNGVEQVAPLRDLEHVRSEEPRRLSRSLDDILAPIRAMSIKIKMGNGVGGTTIATHLPEGRKFIVRDHKIFTCSGSIDENGQCSGTLTEFKVNEKHDYCYIKNNYSIVNNKICVGASSVIVINGVVTCQGNPGSPALLTTIQEFHRLCQGRSEKVEYKYIANSSDPEHIEIPNSNKHVKCTNNQAGVCIYTQ